MTTEKEVLQLAIIGGVELDPSMFDDNTVRREAYQVLGWTEKAFDDEYWCIRQKAYQILGWTEKALMDVNEGNQREAQQFFELKEKYSDGEVENIINLWKLERI